MELIGDFYGLLACFKNLIEMLYIFLFGDDKGLVNVMFFSTQLFQLFTYKMLTY